MPSPPAPPRSPAGATADRVHLVQSLRWLTPSLARSACGEGPPANRRSEIRRALRLGCRVRRATDLRLVGDRAIDLSPRGTLVLSEDDVDSGMEVVVSFMATDFPIWFDTRATVTRVIEGRRPGDAGRAIGLRFDSLPAVSRLMLRGHLRKIPPTLPQRELPLDLRRPAGIDYARQIAAIRAS
jgi:hypothetical protein